MRLFRAFTTAASLLLLQACTTAAAQVVASPSEHLGRDVGADFELADWEEVSSYFRRLGAESPHAITEQVGTTTEGRDFLITTISSPENLADLERIRQRAHMLADPRGRSDAELQDAVEHGRVILFVSCQMHSTEAAGSQFGMEFAWRLATSDDEPWRTARDEIVTVVYVTNPDGVDHVTQWYRETVGTPHEASGLLRLYQLYAGHDNNRDWFMLTQNETRIVTEMLYGRWYPQVYWDVHQQGSSRERMFVPPFRDPLNPNLDANVITGIDVLGSRALMDMTREGLTGISTGVSYDMWWNGGNRNVPVRHNIIGLLTEAASVRLASPVFLPKSELRAPSGLDEYAPSNRFPDPWPGGWWRIGDIIEYQLAFGRSLLGSLAREPQAWRRNALEAARNAIREGREGAPRAWIIPSDNRDPDAVRRLVGVLLLAGVELHVTDELMTADGRAYPAGSIVILREQPYGAHVKDLMEVQRYPGGPPPYDVAGWTLPYLLGVRRVEVMQEPTATLRPVVTQDEALARFEGDPRATDDVHSTRHSRTWSRMAEHLAAGETISFITGSERAGLVSRDVIPAEEGESHVIVRGLPRLGLYSPWSGSMDEGWMRYVFDSFEIPYVTVRNEMVRAGRLGDFLDVLIIPSIWQRQLDRGREPGSVPEEYTGGLAPEGAVAIEEFVRGGGTLITMGSSSQWAIDLFRLPIVDTTRGAEAGDFSCPGSVVRGIPSAGHALTADLPESIGLFFSRSAAYRPMTDAERRDREIDGDDAVEILLRYAPTRVLLSGWIRKPEIIENRAAWVRARHGEGTIHVFGFRPQFRGWTQASFPLIFRAALLDGGS